MVKVVFLDIDGVLNSTRSVHVKIGVLCSSLSQQEAALDLQDEYGELPYGAKFALKCADPVCVGLVNRLLEETGAMLVLSSTHRKHFDDRDATYGSDKHLQYLRLYLTAMGIRVPDLFSITSNMHTPRGEEIETWLNMAYENGVDVDSYVILDDGNDFGSDQPLILIDPAEGLTFENYVEALKTLGAPEPSKILL